MLCMYYVSQALQPQEADSINDPTVQIEDIEI